MKNLLIILGVLAILLLGGGTALYLYAPHIPLPLSDTPSMTPRAQTERITSRILIRKIEHLKDRAVYLQHREEGRRLLELTGVSE